MRPADLGLVEKPRAEGRPSRSVATDAAKRPDARHAWSPSKRQELALLCAVLLVAALFRLPALDRLPNGFFVDEASRGYDAYSLLRTGNDQYGVSWPLFAEGLDDYTPTLYTMLVLPSVALFGLSEFAVRLPAALIGIATVAMTFLAGRASFGPAAGLLAASFLAISPWHVLPGRTGAEWVLLPFFTTTGVWLLQRGRRGGPELLAAGIVLGIGFYSYAFARLLIPLLVAGFAALWWRDLIRRPAWSLLAVLVMAGFALPLVQFGLTAAGQARLRAVVPLDRYRGLALVPYYLGNLVSYFNPAFLFAGSEPTDFHRLRGIGPILWAMLPGVLGSMVAVVRRPSRELIFWLWWIVAAPMSAALHRESPSSVLMLGAIPAWQILAGFGTVRLIGWIQGRRVLFAAAAALILGGTLVTAAFVGRALYVEYPVYAAEDWQYGARETVAFLEAHRAEYDDVLISDRLVAPQILVLFYGRIDPATYQRDPIHVRQPAVRARGTVGQYRFGRLAELLQQGGRHLVWATADEASSLFPNQTPVLTVRLPDGRPTDLVYSVGER
jgi:4-amino-4-deoxy-L-arabinose transferase-like glycosyltransferase